MPVNTYSNPAAIQSDYQDWFELNDGLAGVIGKKFAPRTSIGVPDHLIDSVIRTLGNRYPKIQIFVKMRISYCLEITGSDVVRLVFRDDTQWDGPQKLSDLKL